ncbi:MAG: hypothetical protein C0412_21120 [Flavobacterium sp.]|nr:hypothetical protein [Flavobacterium sp.]
MGEGQEIPLDENAPCTPKTSYGLSKKLAEDIVLKSNIPNKTVLRLSLVYGNRPKGNLIKLINSIKKNRIPFQIPRILNKRSMIHVDDVVDAAILCLENKLANNEVFILSDGEPYSTYEITKIIYETCNKKIPKLTIPYVVLKLISIIGDLVGLTLRKNFPINSSFLNSMFGSSNYSSQKIKEKLGFKAKRTLSNSIREIIQSN